MEVNSNTLALSHERMETWKRRKEKAIVQCGKVEQSLRHMMRERTVSKKAKKVLRDNIILMIITYACGTWTWNKLLSSKI